ncbi:MAG: GNAT family N-acetyltransferase [Bacillota bacterium]|nr:GNAT family N-acetyltransferase [Bacillota bacterium]
MNIEIAQKTDLSEILNLQKLAFYSEAAACNDFTIPPLVQTIESVEEEFIRMTFYKTVSEGSIIGSVRVYTENDTCFIGRLIVHPDFQNRGIGKQLMKHVEKEFESCGRFELFTGKHSKRNIYFYSSLGYRIFKEEKINDKLSFVYFHHGLNG